MADLLTKNEIEGAQYVPEDIIKALGIVQFTGNDCLPSLKFFSLTLPSAAIDTVSFAPLLH